MVEEARTSFRIYTQIAMLIYIAGILTGMLLSFGARLADKDITRIVERYAKSGSVLASDPKKPVIIPTQEKKTHEQLLKEFNESMNEV